MQHPRHTARKRAEPEVARLHAELEARVDERTAQLQAANRELEAFSYSVSHDLRAPLRRVLGFVELLRKDAAASLSERSQRYLATITAATTQMGERIDDLLAFSQVGRAPLTLEDVSLDRLVAEVVADATAAAVGRTITWTLQALPVAYADRSLWRHLLVLPADTRGAAMNLRNILLVEDDLRDVELTLAALDEHRLANKVQTVHDGAEAMDYLFCRGAFVGRDGGNPIVVLLDNEMPEVQDPR